MIYDIKSVSYALWIIQDCETALKCALTNEIRQMFQDRMERYKKTLPEANDPVWKTSQYQTYFPKFVELTNKKAQAV